MRSHGHLNTAMAIICLYEGKVPLGLWLKQYFREHKKYGSSDRKQISHLCYSYYRLGTSFANHDTEEKMLIAAFLCSPAPNKTLEELRPEWNGKASLPLEKKLDLLQSGEQLEHLFPFAPALSPEIDAAAFRRSFLIQPDLFLRIRPGCGATVRQKLREANLIFEEITTDCLALPNGSKADTVIFPDKEAVVQDRSSQRVIEPFMAAVGAGAPLRIWDCCAASGGKSLLFHDHYPKASLTVSDIRESILVNLRHRFERAGIRQYRAFLADLSSSKAPSLGLFDLVICDAPCSGSGTWGRTPEQLCFFKEHEIDRYAQLQKTIAARAAKSVAAQGYFLYITCSVFYKENEEVVAHLLREAGLRLRSMHYFKGYNSRGDTLFAALFSL